MVKRDKGEGAIVLSYKPKGVPFTPFDDGVKQGYLVRIKDLKERLPNYEGYRSKAISVELVERYMAQEVARAEHYLKYVSEHFESCSEGDKNAALELGSRLLDVRHLLGVGAGAFGPLICSAAWTGMEFGKALEELRVWLESSAVRRGRKVQEGGKKGTKKSGETRKANKQKGYAKYTEAYKAQRLKNEKIGHVECCKRVAEFNGEQIGGRYGIGKGYKTVDRAVKDSQK